MAVWQEFQGEMDRLKTIVYRTSSGYCLSNLTTIGLVIQKIKIVTFLKHSVRSCKSVTLQLFISNFSFCISLLYYMI